MANRFQRLTGAASILVVLTSILLLAFGPSCSRKGPSVPAESITFGALGSGEAALIYVAQDQGLFAANGINVTVKNYESGVATVDALLKGELEVAWSAEYAVVRRAFDGDGLRIVATLSRFVDVSLLCRRDRGIARVADLKGKTIGVTRKTISEFCLSRYLALNSMNTRDVILVDVQAPQSAEALSSGSVDAVVTYDLYATQIQTQMVGNITAWSIQSNQPGFGVISARNDWISDKPERVVRFLKSLAQADNYLVHNPEAGKRLVQRRLNFDDALMDEIWPTSVYSVTLEQALVAAMEDEARWMIENNLTAQKTVPDFRSYIYIDGLEAVRPEVVNIIR